MLKLTTLGGAAARRDGDESGRLTTHRQKYALLTYLALESPVPRDRLLAVFWGERPEERARHSLSQALYALKRELGEEGVQLSADQIALPPDAVHVDAEQFRMAVEAEEWDRALELYRGPFLDGFHLPDAPEFEDWLSRTRGRLARMARRAFSRAIEIRGQEGDLQGALSVAWRWAGLEPTEDEAQHTLIGLLARAGNRAAALKQYEAYRERLERELGVEPLAVTVDLMERIRSGAVPEVSMAAARSNGGADMPGTDPVGLDVPDTSDASEIEEEPARERRRAWTRMLEELRSRRVFHVGVLYLGFAWVAIEVADVMIDRAIVPEWVFPVLLFFLAAGLPFALLLAWSQEQQRVGTTGAPVSVGIDWPDWMDQIRGGHVLAVLGIGVVVLLGWLILMERGTANELGRSLPGEKHIAVLPFAAVPEDESVEAFGDGLAETLTSKLTQLERFGASLWVVPLSDVRERQTRSVAEARDAFGINLAITGSLQRTGDSVRVTVNLVDARTLRQVRSIVLDQDVASTSGLQDGIVEALITLLQVELGDKASQVLAAGRTDAPRAYDYYLQGRGYLQRFEQETNVDNAIQLFDRALGEDPDYALAVAGLGEAYLRKYEITRDERWVDSARVQTARAVALDRELPAVHVTRGLMHATVGEYEEAVAVYGRALALDSLSSEAYRGTAHALQALGRPDSAEAIYRKAIELRPNYWGTYNDLGAFYASVGRYAEAAEQFQRVVDLTPDNIRGYSNLGAVYYYMGRHDAAARTFERSLEIRPTAQTLSNLGTLYFYLGRYSRAAEMFERAVEQAETDFRLWQNLGAAYRWAPGQRHRAFDAFQKCVELGESDLAVNPRNASVMVNVADCHAMLGRSQQAREYVERALELAPGDVEVQFRAANVYEQLGERQRALEWIDQALRNGYPIEEIERSPDLSDLRSDPGYQAIRARLEAVP